MVKVSQERPQRQVNVWWRENVLRYTEKQMESRQTTRMEGFDE